MIAIAAVLTGCETPEISVETLPLAKLKPLKQLQIDYEYSAPAQILSINDSRLSAEISATIESVEVKVGDSVTAGQALLTLNCLDAINRLEESKGTLASLAARAELAEQQFKRAKKLRAQSNLSEEDLNLRQAELKALRSDKRAQQAKLAIAQADTERCSIRAPFDGIVYERTAQIGQLAAPNGALVRIVDIENVEVSAQISSADIASLQQSNNARFVHKRQSYPLQLRAIAAVINATTRTQEARFEFVAEKPAPGTAGRIIWRDPRPVLPAHLVSQREGVLGVLFSNDNSVQFHPLPEAIEGQPAFIDLPPDTAIITDGRLGLAVGAKFETLN